jgi:hypothetical protein
MGWYLSVNGVVSGPHDEATMRAWAKEGRLRGAAVAPPGGAWHPYERSTLASGTPWGAIAAVGVATVALLFCGFVSAVRTVFGEDRERKREVAAAPVAEPPEPECRVPSPPGATAYPVVRDLEIREKASDEDPTAGDRLLAEALIAGGVHMVPVGTRCREATVGSTGRFLRIVITEGPHRDWVGYVPRRPRGGLH